MFEWQASLIAASDNEVCDVSPMVGVLELQGIHRGAIDGPDV